MKITIIIQNKNYARFLKKTILSCIIQDYPRDQYEIIGYDAHSTDESMEMYKEFKDRIKIIEVGDKNQPEALNEVLKQAKGEYISIINSDDWLLSHFLRVHADALDKNPEVILAYSNSYRENEQGARQIYEPKDNGKLIPKEEIFKRNFVFQPSTMMRRSALDKISLFDEKLKHVWDYDAWQKLAKIGDWAYVDSITTIYRIHHAMNSMRLKKEMDEELKKLVKNDQRDI